MLCWRREVAVQLSYGPVAMLTSIYVNAHLKEGASPTEPADFIPGAKGERTEPIQQFEPGVIPITPDEFKRRFSAGPSGKR